MTQLYLDETVCYSILAGILVLLAGTWVLWGAGWLRRVELQAIAEPCARALGLSFRPEGWGAAVCAGGTLAGRAVEVRWHAALTGAVRVHARVDATWVEVAADRVEAEVRGLVLPS